LIADSLPVSRDTTIPFARRRGLLDALPRSVNHPDGRVQRIKLPANDLLPGQGPIAGTAALDAASVLGFIRANERNSMRHQLSVGTCVVAIRSLMRATSRIRSVIE